MFLEKSTPTPSPYLPYPTTKEIGVEIFKMYNKIFNRQPQYTGWFLGEFKALQSDFDDAETFL